MKKLLLSTLIIALYFISCEIVNQIPMVHRIEMAITDEDNNDLVSGLKCLVNNHKDNGYCLISEQEFQCNNLTEKTSNFDPTVNTTKEPHTIILSLSTYPNTYPSEIKFEITCYHIFKDFEKHEITTKWVHPKTESSYCSSVIFEGKEYTPERGEQEINSYVKIVK